MGDNQGENLQSKNATDLDKATEKFAPANTLFSFGTSLDKPTSLFLKNDETVSSSSVLLKPNLGGDDIHPDEAGDLGLLVSSSNDLSINK